MSEKWSERLSREFGVRFTPDIEDWFDGSFRLMSEYEHFGRYAIATDPSHLLDESSSVIWAGSMLPDSFPILQDGGGNVISARFDRDGEVAELVEWDHETGEWRNCGANLAEAILCDLAMTLLESSPDEIAELGEGARTVERWAVQWVERSTGKELKWPEHANSNTDAFECLVDAGICEVFTHHVRCERSLQTLFKLQLSELKSDRREAFWSALKKAGLKLTLSVPWDVDTALAPESFENVIARFFDQPAADLLKQDWDAAQFHAARVLEARTDQGWAHLILGRAAERNGKREQAAKYYLDALRSSENSYAFTPMLSRGFVLDRLAGLKDQYDPASLEAPYREMIEKGTAAAYARSCQHWIDEAGSAMSKGDHASAYDCYYRVGWDTYCIDYAKEALEGLVESARAAGWVALSKIAALHLANLPALDSHELQPTSRGGLIARALRLAGRFFGGGKERD